MNPMGDQKSLIEFTFPKSFSRERNRHQYRISEIMKKREVRQFLNHFRVDGVSDRAGNSFLATILQKPNGLLDRGMSIIKYWENPIFTFSFSFRKTRQAGSA